VVWMWMCQCGGITTCDRTFQGLLSVRLRTPTILLLLFTQVFEIFCFRVLTFDVFLFILQLFFNLLVSIAVVMYCVQNQSRHVAL
jgi:hypothetical protein